MPEVGLHASGPPGGQGAPLVSVVIPTLNAGAALGPLLQALLDQRLPGELEIVVVDSGSVDRTVERARRAGAAILHVPQRRFGHGRTRNQAIRRSRGQFVVLTVQDALPADDLWIARLLDPLLRDDAIAGSYGLQVAPDESSLLARSRSLLWRDAHSEPAFKRLADPSQFAQLTPEARLDLVRFDNVASCLRRSAWERWPLPDRHYAEDMSWAKELLLAGRRLAYVPDARVWHAHERSGLYELRRAFVDGATRVGLVDWPNPNLPLREAVAVLRRLSFFARTRRFDPVAAPEDAQRFLQAEIGRYQPLASSPAAQVYAAGLWFAVGLTGAATRLSPGGRFAPGEWAGFLRFALLSVSGQALGAAAAHAQRASLSFDRLGWAVLDCWLNRRI